MPKRFCPGRAMRQSYTIDPMGRSAGKMRHHQKACQDQAMTRSSVARYSGFERLRSLFCEQR